jgi:hypothetical protein
MRNVEKTLMRDNAVYYLLLGKLANSVVSNVYSSAVYQDPISLFFFISFLMSSVDEKGKRW